MNIMEIAKNAHENERITSGHRLCAGCAESIILKMIFASTTDPVVVVNATSCLEVASTIYPYTAWRTPWMHNAFENASATMSGIVETFHALMKKPITERPVWAQNLPENTKFLVVGGDGGSYDIGLQSLSGALERGHQLLYVCYDNEAYMNTGNQRSGATPRGADTSTCPSGTHEHGKKQNRKNLTAIVEGHNIGYVAQASISNFVDFSEKVKKAFATTGPSFINVISPCQRSWGYDPAKTVEMAKLAVEANFWPLYEIDQGIFRLNYEPKNRLAAAEWFKLQKRFKNLLAPEHTDLLAEIQKEIDDAFTKLKKRAEVGF